MHLTQMRGTLKLRDGAAERGVFSLRVWWKQKLALLLSIFRICVCPHLESFQDEVTGNMISVLRSGRFLTFTVNQRDYVFDLLDGQLVGTGSGCGTSRPSHCKASRRLE